MKVLLPFFIVVLVVAWSQVAFAAGNRASRLLLQTYRSAAELQREIDILVARGYVLFTGSWYQTNDELDGDSISADNFMDGKRGIERILIRDADSPVYRYAEQENVGDLSFPVEPPARSTPLQLQAIAEGRKHEIADPADDQPGTKEVVLVDHMLHTTYWGRALPPTELQAQGWQYYTLQVEDGSYPDTPKDIDALQLITEANTVALVAASNYRVYRGEIDSQWLTLNNEQGKHIETITINNDDPKTIYRHTLDLGVDGKTITERLSVGVVTRTTEGGVRKIQEITLDSENPQDKSGPETPRTNKYELQPNDASSMILSTTGGSQKVLLQLIGGTDNK